MFDGHLAGEAMLRLWPYLLVASGLGVGVVSGFFKARRIQPGRFKWRTFRNEALFAAVNLTVSAWTLGPINGFLRARGFIEFNHAAAPWWMIAGEFALYFVLFDTWFYWLHRGMHKEPFYSWIHKLHHKSTAPNLLTTFSVNPLESLINGGFLPLFLTVFTMHDATAAVIIPANIVMGLYVHAGHEFLPRWWNRTWATKWFITTTFHDQHHKYFNYNFGGYSPAWDYLCGTVRRNYEADFANPRARPGGIAGPTVAAPASEAAGELAAG